MCMFVCWFFQLPLFIEFSLDDFCFFQMCTFVPTVKKLPFLIGLKNQFQIILTLQLYVLKPYNLAIKYLESKFDFCFKVTAALKVHSLVTTLYLTFPPGGKVRRPRSMPTADYPQNVRSTSDTWYVKSGDLPSPSAQRARLCAEQTFMCFRVCERE